MDETSVKAIRNRLCSAPAGAAVPFSINNLLGMPVIGYMIDENGLRYAGKVIKDKTTLTWDDGYVGCNFVVVTQVSGSFVTCKTQSDTETSLQVDESVLTAPNQIGDPPQPSKTVPVPANSPLVLVSLGKTGKNFALREQYWNLQGDSYSIAPGETRTYSYSVVSGRQDTSSTSENVQTSLTGSASGGGWGTVSAGLSVSLNASASFFQQVTTNEQSTSFVEDIIKTEEGDKPMIVLKWQLTDVITVYDDSGKAESSIVSTQNPIIAEAFPLDGLEDDPDPAEKLSPIKLPPAA